LLYLIKYIKGIPCISHKKYITKQPSLL